MQVDQILQKYFPVYETALYEPLREIEKERDRLIEQVIELKKEIYRLNWMLDEHD